MSVHVLTRLWKLPAILRRRLPGIAIRCGLAGASLATGAVLATLTLPAADQLQDQVSAQVCLDAR